MNPKAKQSARFTSHGVYQDPDVKAFQERLRMDLHNWMVRNHMKRIRGAVYARVIFYMKKGSKNAKPFPTQRPDMDNLEKMLWDAMNTVMFEDDSQIVGKAVDQFWGDSIGEGYYIELYDMEAA